MSGGPTRPVAPGTNGHELVATVVAGQVANHLLRGHAYRIGRQGEVFIVPGSGGISLNHRIGDRAIGLAGDHVEPGVSARNNDRESVGAREHPNRAFMALSCVGNSVRVLTGPAAGAVGIVTGKHGGINHVLVDFSPQVKRRLRIGDRLQVEAVGQGLRLPSFPRVRCLNLSTALLSRWGVATHGRHLHVPVTHFVPAALLGSGLGRSDGVLGDCDIQLSDAETVRRWRLDSLRFGDLVAVAPATFAFGPSRQAGAITFGVIVHGDSRVSGHGPGFTPLLMGPSRDLRPYFSAKANLAILFRRRDRLAGLPRPSQAERKQLAELSAAPA